MRLRFSAFSLLRVFLPCREGASSSSLSSRRSCSSLLSCFFSCKVVEILMECPGILDNRTVSDVPDPCCEPVHKGLVVGDKEERPVEIVQGINEDFRGNDVQVVGRFVHDDQVARVSQGFLQGKPAPFPLRKEFPPLCPRHPLKRERRRTLPLQSSRFDGAPPDRLPRGSFCSDRAFPRDAGRSSSW